MVDTILQGEDTRIIIMITEGLMLRLADIRGVDIRVMIITEDHNQGSTKNGLGMQLGKS